MKKGKEKVVLAQPAVGAPPQRPLLSRAPAPVRGAGEDAEYWARLRHRRLLADYRELAEEVEAKKEALLAKKMKKNQLLAEVKFLRKRFEFLSGNSSRTLPCKLKDPAVPPPPSLRPAPQPEARYVVGAGSSSKGVLVLKNPSPGIDLNQACQQNNEMEMEGNYIYHGPVQKVPFYKVKKYPVEGDAAPGPSDVKMPAVPDDMVRAGKRKISWQDQLPLKV